MGDVRVYKCVVSLRKDIDPLSYIFLGRFTGGYGLYWFT